MSLSAVKVLSDLFQTTRTIKALSLWQPWASLMARGVKIDETRHWSTNYRGPMAVHAAKTLDLAGAPDRLCASALGIDWLTALPRGAVVAIADLVNVRPAAEAAKSATRGNLTAGNFTPGRVAWRFENIRPLLEPIPLVGRQEIYNWDPPEDIFSRLGPPIDHGAICHRLGWS